MAEPEEDFSSLPLPDRFAHKVSSQTTQTAQAIQGERTRGGGGDSGCMVPIVLVFR